MPTLRNCLLEDAPGKDWEYFDIPYIRDVHFIDHGQNEFELVVLVSASAINFVSFLLSQDTVGERKFPTERNQYHNRWKKWLRNK